MAAATVAVAAAAAVFAAVAAAVASRIANRASVGPRQNGTLKFFNNDRGFGFITPESGGKDVFVHISAIERSGLQQLAEGTKLSFETEDDRRGRGPQAVNLQLVEE